MSPGLAGDDHILGEIRLVLAGEDSATPDAGSVRLGASLSMGCFAQQSRDVLNADLTPGVTYCGAFGW